LRDAVCLAAQGECKVVFDNRDDINALAEAIRTYGSKHFADEVGAGSTILPQGARVQIEVPSRLKSVPAQRKYVAKRILRLQEGECLHVLMRPVGTDRAPPLDPFGKELFRQDPKNKSRRTLKQLAQSESLSKEKALDKLLLVLFDALLLSQAEDWTSRGVANLTADETYELARWFALGQNVAKNPIYDGICAMCGALLHGIQNKGSALSNKCSAPPCDRDGKVLMKLDGSPQTDAQPPFLLRYSPQLFAKEAPEMFVHDANTNRLSLKPDVLEPWIRPSHPKIPADDPNSWLYCAECRERWFRQKGERPHSHVPFRDKASQNWLKPTYRRGKEKEEVEAPEEEPEGEPSQLPSPIESEGGEGEEEEEQEWVPELPQDVPQRPSLAEYEKKWETLKSWYSRCVPSEFNRDNLVPEPVPQLWQDCPYVPFDKLHSTEAQSRLSVCRPHSGLEPASIPGGVPRYAHNTGGVIFRRWASLQVANTMGLVLNKSSGKYTGLTPAEIDAVHECLTWGRQNGNNKVLTFFGTVFESFHNACRTLMGRFRNVIPEGCLRARIRATKRESHNPKEGCLADTLGEESHGMVVVDAGGHPLKYDALTVMEDVVATQTSRIEIDIPGEGGRGWQRTGSSVEVEGDGTLNEAWRRDIAQGAQHLREETYVRLSEPHYDAKVWPHVHPYGTGSLLAEPGAGSAHRHARNRLMAIQSFFRSSAMWSFWFLNRLIVAELFFTNRKRQAAGRSGASTGTEEDPITRLYGTAQPSSIPESTAWWQKQQKDLFAISDDAELGLMQAMVTVTHNDSCPEMLAAIRRGPFAKPREEEFIEYLLKRKPRDRSRPEFEQFSLEHVLSFQRRVYHMKQKFMVRNRLTPLGRLIDWWDRTEAQMRAALHSHILCWFQHRDPHKQQAEDVCTYTRLPYIPRTALGSDPKQRPRAQTVEKLSERHFQEDTMYHYSEVARIVTDMVRPYVAGASWGGFGSLQLRIAGLARIIQSKLYLHQCSTKYCLQNRSTCRFFFPWPYQPQQQYDANTERVACQRRCEEDDQWLNPHNLYLMMFSPSTIHVLPFDPHCGKDTARVYAGKYASKAEKWYS